jgi:hypothetical protein
MSEKEIGYRSNPLPGLQSGAALKFQAKRDARLKKTRAQLISELEDLDSDIIQRNAVECHLENIIERILDCQPDEARVCQWCIRNAQDEYRKHTNREFSQ